MATVHCPLDGRVVVPALTIHLVVSDVPDLSRYTFTCPDCGDEVTLHACDEAVSLLRFAGVTPIREIVAADAREPHDGPPITEDDVLDFALAVEHVRFLAPIAGVGERAT